MPKLLQLSRLSFIATLPVAVSVFSVWYWHSGHGPLAVWYKNLNPYFYQAGLWETSFFTEEIKRQGNWWCALAIMAAFIGAYFCWKTPVPVWPKIVFKKKQILIYTVIAIAGAGLSLVANFHTLYSSDEVFSALNFARLPIFQTLSYYALPNNHPLFNCISGWGDDPVMAGRLVSLVCYIGVLFFTWYFLGKWQINHWSKAIAMILVASQFSVWGFSGQARGYEMVLLFSCLSFGAFYNYYVTGAKHWLPLHTACNILGMLTIPTFLYWWVGLLLASFIFQIKKRRTDWAFVRTSIIGFSLCFISYLPLLVFSGLQSITSNKYVQAAEKTRWHFMAHLNESKYFNVLFKEWFCTDQAVLMIGAICVLLPVLLFIYPKKSTQSQILGITYYSMLLAFLAMAVLMLKFPFTRNLIAHGYLFLLVSSIVILHSLRPKKIQIIMALILLIYAGYAAKVNYKKIPYHLYYYDLPGYVIRSGQFKTDFPPESTVYVDDECFNWWYILRKKFPERALKIALNKPRFNHQDFCIIPNGLFPPADTAYYQLLEVGVDCQIFGKRE